MARRQKTESAGNQTRLDKFFTMKKARSTPQKKRSSSRKLRQTQLDTFFTMKTKKSTPLKKKRPPPPKLQQTTLEIFLKK